MITKFPGVHARARQGGLQLNRRFYSMTILIYGTTNRGQIEQSQLATHAKWQVQNRKIPTHTTPEQGGKLKSCLTYENIKREK